MGESINIPPHGYIYVARFISSYLMNVTLEPQMRLSLNLMKYAINSINHPDAFTNVSLAFLQGFQLFVVTLATGILSIAYISTMDDVIEIIIREVTLGAIAKVALS